MYSVSLPELSFKELSEVGFSSEVMEYLATSGVSKDDVVLMFEEFPDLTLDACIGNIKISQASAEPVIEVMPEVSSDLPTEVGATE